MRPVHSPEDHKDGKNYVNAEGKEEIRVNGLMSRAGGYKFAVGYKNARRPEKTNAYRKKTRRVFVPTQCKFCGSEVSYGSVSKSRLHTAGSAWIDTCDACAVAPDVSREVKIYV